jgi:hypothetical protein
VSVRRQRFRYVTDLSDEFRRAEPKIADDYLAAFLAEWGKVQGMLGPRGGMYRLDTEPTPWVSAPHWRFGMTSFMSERHGHYVRPSRVTTEMRLGEAMVFTTFTIPVRAGKAILPKGRTVETTAKFVDVPIPLPHPD